MKRVAFLFFLGAIFVYYITSAGNTPYDYFTRLSDAFLEGKYYLNDNPSWLSELIPATGNRYYVVYPPAPAILLMFPRFVFGSAFKQQYLAHILGGGIVAFTILTTYKITKDKILSLFSGIMIGFGSIVWFLSSVGSSWYLGQITAAFFLTVAVFESFSKKRPVIIGLAIGFAYLSRIHTILSLPFFLYLLRENGWFKKYLYLALGILPFILFNFYYNYIRFGTILDQAYFLLPKILNEEATPWFIHGVANITYIPNNLKTMFWSFPKVISEFPFIIPSWGGLSIWITTPVFALSLFASLKERINRRLWLAILPIFLIITSHGGTGWAQFGYRFAVDFYPFLTILTILGIKRLKGPNRFHWLLLSISVLVNLWGVIWINKFGWVSF